MFTDFMTKQQHCNADSLRAAFLVRKCSNGSELHSLQNYGIFES